MHPFQTEVSPPFFHFMLSPYLHSVQFSRTVVSDSFYHIGSGAHKPHGIYLDDALSGQQIYGNLLVDIPGSGMLIGGGRDNLISGNIIANPGQEEKGTTEDEMAGWHH